VQISQVLSSILERTSEVGQGNIDVSDNVSKGSDRPSIVIVETSPIGFQEKEKGTDLSKKEKDKIIRKDSVCSANLTSSKIKDILKYPCCDSRCLWEMGLDALTKHRTFYFGLPLTERTILLRGCLQNSHTGRTGYEVVGKTFCRTGFKKLFSVGNNRL